MVSDTVRYLFPQLLANGYVPIPNRDKECWLPKWPTVLVDEAQCRRWTRQTRWPAIGLRVEPPLLVIDFDIPDRDILKAIEDITPSVVFDGLERIGNAPKTAFFLRMAGEPFYKLSTHRYMKVVDGVPVKPAFAVEAFSGGGGGKQIGAFGPHSHDANGTVLKTYRWVGERSPANVRLDQLPTLSRIELADFLDEVDLLLAARLAKDELSRRGEYQQGHEYDLTDDSVFVDAEGFTYGLAELIAEAKARHELRQAPLRLTGSFTGDLSSSGSARCKVHWSRQHGLSIVDFKTGITHHVFGNANDPELDRVFNEIFQIAGR